MRDYIDINCFMGTPPGASIRTFDSPGEILEEMDDAGISRAFVSAFDARRQFCLANYALSKSLEGCGRLMACWTVNPGHLLDKSNSGGLSSLISEIKDAGVRMVRVQPGPLNGYSLHRWIMEDFTSELIRNRVILFVDIVVEEGLSHKPVPAYEWEALHGFAAGNPELSIILSASKLSVSKIQVMGLLKSCGNVMLDISSFQTWRSLEMITAAPGPEQLVFGSKMPFFDPAQFVVQVEKAAIPAAAKTKIASGNIESVLRGGWRGESQ